MLFSFNVFLLLWAASTLTALQEMKGTLFFVTLKKKKEKRKTMMYRNSQNSFFNPAVITLDL